ncbi:MAG: class I SAM-dependent methyltransferase [Candidatus Omnitrophica bacterium]|nr:class I SAM-dependent methyltransferase [Candidatus Omnitrophota bacterium]
MSDDRLKNEIEHGKLLRQSWSGQFWYWETPAGKRRFLRRLKLITSHIKPDMKVLELGCGVGYFTEYLAQTNAYIVANDISPDLLDVAKSRVVATNVEFKVENAYDLTYSDDTFDSVVGSSVVHHLELEDAVKECFRVLKPGGSIYFAEPNLMNPHVFLERSHKVIRRMANVSPNETAFLRGSLHKVLAAHKFRNISIVPFDFLHPLTPPPLIPFVENVGRYLERIPILKEFSGSLFITAQK